MAHHREINRFDEGCEPQLANNGGMMWWTLIVPFAVIALVAYVYGVSW